MKKNIFLKGLYFLLIGGMLEVSQGHAMKDTDRITVTEQSGRHTVSLSKPPKKEWMSTVKSSVPADAQEVSFVSHTGKPTSLGKSKHFKAFLEIHQQLETLSVVGFEWPKQHWEIFTKQAGQFTALTTLKIENCQGLKGNGKNIGKVIGALPVLSVCSLATRDGKKGITDTDLQKMTQGVQKVLGVSANEKGSMTTLSLQGHSKITDASEPDLRTLYQLLGTPTIELQRTNYTQQGQFGGEYEDHAEMTLGAK